MLMLIFMFKVYDRLDISVRTFTSTQERTAKHEAERSRIEIGMVAVAELVAAAGRATLNPKP